MSRPAVSVRIRGRGETTLEVQFKDAETVAEFKARVFGDDIAEGQKCRLIASGKELEDSQRMGLYRLREDACLHVMISQKGSDVRAARASPGAAAADSTSTSSSSSSSSAAAAAASSPSSGRSFIGAGDGYLILCTLTLGMLVSVWTLFMSFPELFSPLAVSLLALLTLLQLAAIMPLLWNAMLTVLEACHRSSRVPGRRRQ